MQRHLRLLLALASAAAACDRRSGPERAVIEYVGHVREARCDEAFQLLSSRYRDALREEARARDAERATLADSPEPIEILYCNVQAMDRVELDRTRLGALRDTLADVVLVETVPAGHLVPGFWATRTDLVDRPMRTVREAEHWRVEDLRMLESLERFRQGRLRQAEAREFARARNAHRR